MVHRHMTTVIEENSAALNAHLTAIADIIAIAGAQDPINRLQVSSPDLPSMLMLRWSRD